jgi:hypothetical protein
MSRASWRRRASCPPTLSTIERGLSSRRSALSTAAEVRGRDLVAVPVEARRLSFDGVGGGLAFHAGLWRLGDRRGPGRAADLTLSECSSGLEDGARDTSSSIVWVGGPEYQVQGKGMTSSGATAAIRHREHRWRNPGPNCSDVLVLSGFEAVSNRGSHRPVSRRSSRTRRTRDDRARRRSARIGALVLKPLLDEPSTGAIMFVSHLRNGRTESAT